MRRSQAGQPEELTALDAYVKLWRAAHAAEVCAHRHLSEHSLTLSQFAVLEALYHVGPLNQRQLADKILRSSGNLTMVIDNLERDGLVRRERDPSDRRVMIVSLMPAGEELLAQIWPAHVAGLREIFEALDADELSQLASLTRKLGLALQERCQRRVPRDRG